VFTDPAATLVVYAPATFDSSASLAPDAHGVLHLRSKRLPPPFLSPCCLERIFGVVCSSVSLFLSFAVFSVTSRSPVLSRSPRDVVFAWDPVRFLFFFGETRPTSLDGSPTLRFFFSAGQGLPGLLFR